MLVNQKGVTVDHSHLLTPLGRPIQGPEALLFAVEGELAACQNKTTTLKASRPLYQLTSQSIDFIEGDTASFVAMLLNYFMHDVTCYAQPENDLLYAAQVAHWFPLHRWAERTLGIQIAVKEELGACDHGVSSREAMRCYLENQSPLILSGLLGAGSLTASLLIPVALEKGHLTGEEAFQLSFLEELTQNQQWGVDHEAEIRQSQVREQLTLLAHYFHLVHQV